MDSNVLRKLKEWQEKAEASPDLVEFYQSLLDVQSRAEWHIGVPKLHLSDEAVKERLERGLPLVAFDELNLDWSLVQDVFVEVASLFAGYPRLFGTVPRRIVDLKADYLPLREAVRSWFEGARLSGVMVVEDTNELLLENIIQAALKPFLASYSKVLLGHVDQERWRRGYCPICGGNPDFAFLDRERGARWLVCCRCDAEWLFQRLECPYCGNQDQNTLAYFTDDRGLYRLYVCERCHTYIKAIDLRCAEPEVLFPLERIMTLDIDSQAQEYGYIPCGRPSRKPG